MKRLLIIVAGSKTKSIPVFQFFLNKFYSFFGVDIGNNDWPNKLGNFLKDQIDVNIFKWSGGISETFSLGPASKKLTKLLNNLVGYDEIVLFSKSLGGVVMEQAVKKTSNNNVKKIIYVATPHKSSKIKFSENIEVINIYSNSDKYQKLANNILYFGFGKRVLNCAKNICIKNLNHSDFNINKLVKINGEKVRIFNFYKNIIE